MVRGVASVRTGVRFLLSSIASVGNGSFRAAIFIQRLQAIISSSIRLLKR